jgi:hypothetical protein
MTDTVLAPNKIDTTSYTTTTLVSDITRLTNTYGLPYARSIPLLIELTGMKPMQTMHAFIDSSIIDANILPCAQITITSENGKFLGAGDITISNTGTQIRELDTTDTQGNLASLYPNGVWQHANMINKGEIVRYYISSNQFVAGLVIARQIQINPISKVQTTVLHVALMRTYYTATGYTDNFTSKSAINTTSFPIGVSIRGDSSGATATVSAVSVPTWGSINTNSLGNWYGLYVIPPGIIHSGDHIITMTDDITNSGMGLTVANASFQSYGELDTYTHTIIQRVDTFTTVTTTQEQWKDPLAQTFQIPVEKVNGCFITSIDIYFSAIGTGETQPVVCQITDTANGYPGRNILFNATAQLSPSDINVSSNGLTATRFNFNGPVFLEPGKDYTIKLLSNSVHYKVWISQMGDAYITDPTRYVTQQPYLGVLFKSKNNSTWTPDQNQCLKFVVYQAKFNSGVSGLVTLQNQTANTLATLPTNPFLLATGQTLVKVYAPDHGFFQGSYVGVSSSSYTPLNGQFTVANVINTDTFTFNRGAFVACTGSISATTLTISAISAGNIIIGTQITGTGISTGTTVTGFISASGGVGIYTINTSQTAGSTAISEVQYSGRTGGSNAKITKSIKYDSLVFDIGMDTSLRAGTSTFTTFVPSTVSGKDTVTISADTPLTQTRFIHSDLNESIILGGKKSLDVNFNIFSTTPDLSPVINRNNIAVMLLSNKINLPSTANNTVLDNNQIVTAHSGLIFNLTTNIIGVPTTIDINQFKIGSYITISGTTSNNWTTKILDIDTGTVPFNVYVDATLAAETPASTTIVQAEGYIDDIAPTGGTAESKYQTEKITLLNPATAMQINFSALIPPAAEIQLYYRSGMSSTGKSLDTVKWTPVPMSYTKSQGTNFIDQSYTVNAITNFNLAQWKIVMTTTDSTQVPFIKGFTSICLA